MKNYNQVCVIGAQAAKTFLALQTLWERNCRSMETPSW